MSLIIPYNELVQTLFAGASIGASSPTQAWFSVRARILSHDNTLGTSQHIARVSTQASTSDGMVASMSEISGEQRINLRARSGLYNAGGTTVSMPVGQWMNATVAYDYAAGELRRAVNGVIIQEDLAIGASTWVGGRIPQVCGQSAGNRVMEISHVYFCNNGVLDSTALQAIDWSFSDPDALSAVPTWGIVPTGWQGDWAGVLEDVVGSNNLTLVAGATSEDAVNRPYFSGPARTLFFLSGKASAGGYKPKVKIDEASTLYVSVGLITNNADDPTPAQIILGDNADNSDAVFADNVAVEITEEQELNITGLSEGNQYKMSAVLDDGETTSNPIYSTFSTLAAANFYEPVTSDMVHGNQLIGMLNNINSRLNTLEE